MKSKIIVGTIIITLLAACSSSRSFTPARNEPSLIPNTNIPLATYTSIPTQFHTKTPLSTETLAVTLTPTSEPWKSLEKDLQYGDWYYRCKITGVSADVIEILPKVDAAGFLFCGNFKIPLYVYDRNENILYFWGLLPIKDPKGLDQLGKRAVGRFLRVFGFGGTYDNADKLIGIELSMAINLPNDINRAVFDTQNIGRFAGEYWGGQEAVDLFAQTGVLPNSDNILYPISFGVVK